MSATIESYCASELAAAIGWSKARVQGALAGTPPTDTKVVVGNELAAWALAALPERLAQEIARVRDAHRYKAARDVLLDPVERWEPALPLSQVHPEEIATAKALQAALLRALRLPETAPMKQREELAAADYRAAFGRAVSDRYLRKLIARTLERDNRRGQFDRLDLFLPDKPRPASPQNRLSVRGAFDFGPLETYFHGCEDRGNPSPAEIAYCWRGVVSFWHDQVNAGKTARELRPALLAWLDSTLPRLGKTRAGLSRNLDRKLTAEIILDRRAEKSGNRRRAPQWEENIERLARLARQWGGRIAQAWRALFTGEAPTGERFSEAFRAYFPSYDPRHDKSRVPASVMAVVRRQIEATEALALGPKAARKGGPRGSRDWSDVMAGDAWTCDDVTQNHYFHHWCEDGEYEFEGRRFNVTRGQFLPVICEGTDYPLGFALIPRRTYNSRDILTLMARICMSPEIGLPHRRWVFERGVWKALSLANALVGWQERVSTGFARQGRSLRIHHATSAGAKVIENYIGRLQNATEHLPGYAGRNEQRDCPERTKTALAKLKRVGQPRKAECDPAEAFLSHAQLAQEIEAAMNRLKREPMKGKRHNGTSPEEEWKKRWREFHTVLPESLQHSLFTDEKDVTVRPDGLRLRIGGDEFEYCGSEQLGALIGEKVRVRFNPELPESVTACHLRSDPKELAPFAVPLKQRLPAYDATPEQFAEKRRQRKAFLAHGKTIYRTMRPVSNVTICDTSRIAAEVLESGEAHRRIEREVIELRHQRQRHGGELEKVGRQIGLKLDRTKSKDPGADLDRARRAVEREERLRRLEAGTTPPHEEP
jgi:hypothetical protein